MNSNISKILIASNIVLLGGFIWLFISRSGAGHDRPLKNEMAADPKTGESFYHKNEVKNTIIKNSDALQKCYKNFLAQKPKIESGTLKIDWQVLPNGKTEKVERILNQLGDSTESVKLESCVIKSIQTWEFPPPPVSRSVYVAHSFYFGERKAGPPEMVNVK